MIIPSRFPEMASTQGAPSVTRRHFRMTAQSVAEQSPPYTSIGVDDCALQ
jgi:hypothetical protein